MATRNGDDLCLRPEDCTGPGGDRFMLRGRGDSRIDLGIMDGDFVVARSQTTADNGDIVIAGIPGEEATVKTYQRKGSTVTLLPANERLSPMVFTDNEVAVFGRVVTVMRRLQSATITPVVRSTSPEAPGPLAGPLGQAVAVHTGPVCRPPGSGAP